MTPAYVEYGALATVPAPLECRGATLHGFFLEADRDKLAALLDKVFREPSGGQLEYHPLGRHVMLTFGVIDRITVQPPPFNQMGAATEPQVVIWIPAARVRHSAFGPEATSFAMFVPYIWIDNPISLAAGRELFGFPKSFGWPGLPKPGEPEVFTLDAFGVDFGHDQQPSRRRLLTLKRVGEASGAASAGFDSLRELGRHFGAHLFDRHDGRWLLPSLRFVESLVGDLLSEELPEVFLKQFRDIADGQKAALQQIVETKMKVQRLRGMPLPHEYELTVAHVDSEPLQNELGIASQRTSLAYRVEMDFVIPNGTVLWQAS